MDGKLFSQDFLLDGIKTTPVWEALSDDALNIFTNDLKRIYAPLATDSQLNEANTESQVIEKVLDLLGWQDLTLKQVTATSTHREDVPDFLLLPNEQAKQSALKEKRQDRCYRHGIAILEAKRWMRPLDRGDATSRLDPGTPSNQILRYLSSVEVASERAVRWGARVADASFAPLFDDLARRPDLLRAWINYRDLSVQHLGGIYERLLEYSLVVEEIPPPQSSPASGRGGEREKQFSILARLASFARKTSGSYYTHDGLVKLIIRETVGPLIAERKVAFHSQIGHWQSKHELKPDDWKLLDSLDPATNFLDLKICDPAMGSGHFLVSLVDYLADEILETLAEVELEVAAQPWAKDVANPWASPLIARIHDIRNRILTAAHKNRWAVSEAQLDDRHIVRRMILKRVVHGVDKNLMAVELAKVALWLHTFTVGAPLSFLDHHLHCGDSLFGGKVKQIAEELGKLKGGLLQQDDLRRVETARITMNAIGNLTDIDIAEAHESKALMDSLIDNLRPTQRALDFLQAKQWAGKTEAKNYQQTWVGLLNHEYGDNLLESIDLLGKSGIKLFNERQQNDHRVVQAALACAASNRFLHWELAFPTVFSANPSPALPLSGEGVTAPPLTRGGREGFGFGGFDAVIGNPPWDRMKLQEVEWFAERKPEIAKAARAADRKKLIAELEKNNDPLWQDYLAAQAAAEVGNRVARECGDYPLLSGGDTNLYSLFVERAQSLIHSRGAVGLLCPSGIAADKGASEFFRTLTTPSPQPLPRAGGGASAPLSLDGITSGLADVVGQPSRLASSSIRGAGGEGETGSRLIALYDFENRKGLFPDVDSRFKFCALIFGGAQRTVTAARCAFYLHTLEEADDPQHILTLTAQDFTAVNPNTGSAPIFRTRRDADITTAIYRRQPVLCLHQNPNPSQPPLVRGGAASLPPDKGGMRGVKVWPVRYCTMFHMTNDSGLFKRRDELETQGWYLVEQLPLIRPEQFESSSGHQSIADFVRGEVLHLSYTAHDLAPFARDLGYDGAPFKWNEEDRRHHLARLDALFFNLYGISRDDAAYILATFPIVREQDTKAHGRYLTKELILAYMNAVAAGDFTTVVQVGA